MGSNQLLSDEKLTEIAWRAIRANFSKVVLKGASLELKHGVYAGSPRDLSEVGGLLIEVWLQHSDPEFRPEYKATSNADLQMLQEVHQLLPGTLMLLYHGFPDVASKPRRAA